MSSRRRNRRLGVAAVVSGLLACSTVVSPSAFGASGESLVTNPGAETGTLEGWTGSGFSVVQYGSSPSVPSQVLAAYNGLGSWLFRGEQTGAMLTQTVSLASLAAAIDAGHQPLSVVADLGGAGSGPDGMELLMQPQGATGEPLGEPVQLGPPTAADREDQATMLLCHATITAPVGTRSALITLVADGTGVTTASADNISLVEGELASEAMLWPGPIQGPHCEHRILVPPESSGPPPQSSGPSPCATSARLGVAAVIASAPPGRTSAATPPPTPTKPCSTEKQDVAAIVSDIRLTRRQLSLRMSGVGTVNVVIARATPTYAEHSARDTWRPIMHFSLRATAAGVVSRSLHRLEPGRYHVTVEVVGDAKPDAITTRLR